MIYLLTLEPLDNRYTSQWKRWIPQEFKNKGIKTTEIDGEEISTNSGSTNFLNFIQTNKWKSEQILKIVHLFETNQIKNGDTFFFYDAWHYGCIAIKYMANLTGINVKIFGMWHAGSYDPTDLLALANLYPFFKNIETGFFDIYDKSFVATHFHKSVILSRLKIDDQDKIKVTGFPFDFSEIEKYKIPMEEKENIIAFTHRLSPDKQPDLFYDIMKEFPDWKMYVSLEKERKKEEHYKMLAKCRILLSFSLHENWGISCFEGLALNVFPLLPNRLSYSEMYSHWYLYNSLWTATKEHYKIWKGELVKTIKSIMTYDLREVQIVTNNSLDYLKEKHCAFDNILREVIE